MSLLHGDSMVLGSFPDMTVFSFQMGRGAGAAVRRMAATGVDIGVDVLCAIIGLS
jgi:hypothetical protein